MVLKKFILRRCRSLFLFLSFGLLFSAQVSASQAPPIRFATHNAGAILNNLTEFTNVSEHFKNDVSISSEMRGHFETFHSKLMEDKPWFPFLSWPIFSSPIFPSVFTCSLAYYPLRQQRPSIRSSWLDIAMPCISLISAVPTLKTVYDYVQERRKISPREVEQHLLKHLKSKRKLAENSDSQLMNAGSLSSEERSGLTYLGGCLQEMSCQGESKASADTAGANDPLIAIEQVLPRNFFGGVPSLESLEQTLKTGRVLDKPLRTHVSNRQGVGTLSTQFFPKGNENAAIDYLNSHNEFDVALLHKYIRSDIKNSCENCLYLSPKF